MATSKKTNTAPEVEVAAIEVEEELSPTANNALVDGSTVDGGDGGVISDVKALATDGDDKGEGDGGVISDVETLAATPSTVGQAIGLKLVGLGFLAEGELIEDGFDSDLLQ